MTQKEPVSKKEYEELENKTKKLRKNLALEIEINTRYRKALDEIEEYIKEEEWSLLDYVIRDILDIINKAKDINVPHKKDGNE